ncbi:MAG: DUF342 domain-containing protein [Lachnospiraceae bacterium]|nr:DUF342 domain-containing protein [Lachnospiraceae bacterium]
MAGMNMNQLEEQGYTRDQIDEILMGREAGLDTTIYENTEYFAIQMRQIRLGLAQGLAVESYASLEYDWFQMEEIREGLSGNVDITGYASPDISYDRMREIRKGLQNKIDLSPYKQLQAGVLHQLRKALEEKVNIVPYVKQGYNQEQLEEIRLALKQGIHMDDYLSTEYIGPSLREIRLGLEIGVDVSIYASVQYGWQQMREIRLGLENRLDVSYYCNVLYDWQQMREIRLGLEQGLPVEQYKSFVYTAREMRKWRMKLEEQNSDTEVASEQDISYENIEGIGVEISMDGMTATVYLDKGRKRDAAEIMQALKFAGVCYGIDENLVERLVNTSALHDAVVANGTAPQTGEDGWYEYFFRTNLNRAPRVMEDGSVDFQHIDWYELVEEGQKLAVYHNAKAGIDGRAVTGHTVTANRGREMPLLTGSGFRKEPDGKTYIALKSGKIALSGNKMEISQVLVVPEVTLATGNINFDGSVYVKGNIGSGGSVKATEDIVVDGFVESAYIEAGANVLLRQGVNASGNGYIKAGGTVTGKFFEALKMRTVGDIQANHCLNCDVNTQGKLIIAKHSGTLAGGKIIAEKGIRVHHIGNQAGIGTFVKIGIDRKVLKQREEAEAKIKEITKEMQILQHAYEDFQKKYPPELRNTMEMYIKLEGAIFTEEKRLEAERANMTELENRIQDMMRANIVARGTIYEGTVVEIANARWVAHTVNNVTLRKAGNRVALYSN